MFANLVYILCAATSGLCAVLLYRGYRSSGARLLFWSCVCFIGLALNNILLIVDMQLVPMTDLSAWRLVPAVLGVAALLYGLVWETR
jgi:hypothetical protein